MPIARIIKTEEKKEKNPRYLFIDSDPDAVNESPKEIKLKQGQRMQYVPNFKQERTIAYIVGASGSGKSYFARHFADEYKKIYPKRKIYMFSSLTDDPSVNKIKGMKRIKLDANFMQVEFDVNDFKDTLIIFDDIDCLSSKPIKAKVLGILDVLLQTGRHANVSVIYISHVACKGTESKLILNECHSVTFFAQTMQVRSMKYLLESYFGLDKRQVERVRKLPSRWVTIVKSSPTVALYEKGAYVLNSFDD